MKVVLCPPYAISLFSWFYLILDWEEGAISGLFKDPNRTNNWQLLFSIILYHHNLMIYFYSLGTHRLSIIKNKQFIKWFGNERLYIVSFKFRQVLWELCGSSLFPCDFFLWESAQNTYTSKSNYNSRRHSPGYFPGCFFFLFFFSDTSFSKLDIYVISDVNYYLSLGYGYVLVWVLRKSKFWAARTFLTLPG